MSVLGHEQESSAPHEVKTEHRRTAGGGSIDQRANGRFRVRFMTADGRRHSTTFATLDEVTAGTHQTDLVVQTERPHVHVGRADHRHLVVDGEELGMQDSRFGV